MKHRMSFEHGTLCQWANVTLPNLIRFEICTYPDAKTVDFWVSRTIQTTGTWERELVNSMLETLHSESSKRPILIDVGANIGVFTLAAAVSGFQVHAFEPVPRNAEMLRQSLIRNRVDSLVTLHTYALGSPSTREVKMGTHNSNQGAVSHERIMNHWSRFGGVAVASATLDEIAVSNPRLSRPVFLKLDIEGAECHFFEGAKMFLQTNFIIGVIMELQPTTKRCCIEQQWTEKYGPFSMLNNKHGLCPRSKFGTFMHVQSVCNTSSPWDVRWEACPEDDLTSSVRRRRAAAVVPSRPRIPSLSDFVMERFTPFGV